MILSYKFCINNKDSCSEPCIIIDNDPNYLSNLGAQYLTESSNVKKELENIKDVISNRKDSYEFGSEWCSLEVKKNTTTIYSNYDIFEPYDLPTLEISKLLTDWHDFLVENGL